MMSLGTLSETKRHYQLGMIEEVRQAMDRANKELYGEFEYHIFSTVTSEQPKAHREKQASTC